MDLKRQHDAENEQLTPT